MKIEKETFCSLTVAKLRKVQAGKSGDKGYFCFSFFFRYIHVSVHFISVAQSCPTICDPMNGGAWWAAVYGVAQNQTQLK